MKQWRVAALLALCAGGGLVAQQAQEPPPVVFRAEVNYVELDATVTDSQGKVVSDLTAADFDVIEDGKPQKISTFSRVDLPIEKAERPLFTSTPIEPDVQTNRAVEGRVYLIVLDDLHTALARTPRVKRTVRQFIETAMGANDVAAVVYTGRNDASQDFTNNPRLLLQAVDKFTGRKLASATLSRLDGAHPDPGTGQIVAGPDFEKEERSYRARSVMASIRKLSEFMAGLHGRRKAMLWFGEGIDYDVTQAMGIDGSTSSAVLEDIRNAIAAAQRGNVAVYTIDPRGLFDASDDLIESSGTTEDLGIPTATLQAEVRNAQESLRQVAVDTGGFSVLNTNDFATAFDRIIRENSWSYLFGYYSTNDKRDGQSRKLQVRVRRPGLTVRSRNGYIAPSGKVASPPAAGRDAPPAVVTEALGSPLPVASIPMRLFAGSFKGAAPNAAIAIALEMDASHFDFVNRNGAWVEEVDVLTSAMNAAGKSFPGERQKLTLTLKPDTYERVVKNGLRVVTQMDLPPGRYQLRVAAGNTTKAGSVLYDLEVPDFSKGALALSGIALTSQQATNDMGTVRPKNPLGDYLPGPPVATRDFRQGDTLTIFAEVYENARSSQAHQVSIKTELRNDVGKAVAQTSESRSSTELQGKSGGYGFTSNLPLVGTAPGIYVLHVEAQSRSTAHPPFPATSSFASSRRTAPGGMPARDVGGRIRRHAAYALRRRHRLRRFTAGGAGSRVAAISSMPSATMTSTGLSPRTAATLAYLAWWVTGVLFWVVERDDRFVRFHAAQAVTAFSAVALLITVFLVLAAASLSFLPSAFALFLIAAGVTWLGGMALWLVAMWKAAGGEAFRIPLAAGWADRINRESRIVNRD